MRRRKEDLIVIIFASVLVVIVFIIVLIVTNNKQAPTPQKTVTIQTATSTNITGTIPTPTIPALNGKPTVLYDSAAQDKLINAIQDRKSLSQNDMIAKANILAQIPNGQQSGIVYSSEMISIEYIHSADLFQVEILTTNIQNAKNAANVWFRAHGISQQAICSLPVEFYLNYDVASHIRQSNIVFSPLGNGC